MNGQLPFEGDSFIPQEILKLKERFNLKTCVETGTQYGATTKALCEIFDKVITVEADKKYFDTAQENLGGYGVRMWLGKSQDVLGGIDEDNALYYLDAHGCEIGGCPLKEELFILHLKKHSNICIAIHDFKVPGKDFGFDVYDYELCFEEIKDLLPAIYPNGYDYHYNTQADGAYRGIIYIYPKQ